MYVYATEKGEAIRVIDDKTVDKPTLAERRLILQDNDTKLLIMREAIFFLGDLIKRADGKTWFIDSLGKIFLYKKKTRAKLKFHKINKILPVNSGGCIVEVEGISSRMKSLFAPTEPVNYAGILYYGKSLILYGLYPNKEKESWRMV